MTVYKAPLRDMQFVLQDILQIEDHYSALPGGESLDMIMAILEEAAKFSENVLHPLNAVGDRQGAILQEGKVTTAEGFREAYRQFVDNGWGGLAESEDFGGQGLPPSLSSFVYEMYATANHAWSMYPTLTWGAVTTVEAHADPALKQRFLPKLVSGEWSGTMCLTEAHCGSDLGLLRTRAVPNGDGSYAITGGKIFISAGEHDLTENIVHIVLARLPDAPAGVKGISLFLVPKINVTENGELAERNAVSCGALEEKMGIHGNATCVLNFDGAKGYLLGPPHKGMSCMFTFINESRLSVAVQGLGHIEGSYQAALRYASERLQMRAEPRYYPDKPADPIICHADVRRMLLTQKAFAEGGRMLAYFCAKQVDLARRGDEQQRKSAEQLLSLLTPIAKGFITEASIEATNYGIQVLGGHGYIKEWGQEQRARDTRITAIYEGTTAIQGLDLLGRKILLTNGQLLQPFIEMVLAFCDNNPECRHTPALRKILQQWQLITDKLIACSDANETNAASYDFVMFSGYLVLAYFWAVAGSIAEQKILEGAADKSFYQAKLFTTCFYFDRLLPRLQALYACIVSGANNLMGFSEDAFDFGQV